MDAFHEISFLFHFVRQLSQHVCESRRTSGFDDMLSASHALPERGHGWGRVVSAGHMYTGHYSVNVRAQTLNKLLEQICNGATLTSNEEASRCCCT